MAFNNYNHQIYGIPSLSGLFVPLRETNINFNDFSYICSQLDIQAEVLPFNIIEDYYSDISRDYHNSYYIKRMFRTLENEFPLVSSLSELKMATLLHKIIYSVDFKMDDFETVQSVSDKRSADYAVFMLRAIGLNKPSCSRIKNLINKTSKTYDSLIFNDAKKAILAAPPDIYKEYCEDIRKEYSQSKHWSGFRDAQFTLLEKRKELLKTILNNDMVYSTELFIEEFNSQAVENIKEEIDSINKEMDNMLNAK